MMEINWSYCDISHTDYLLLNPLYGVPVDDHPIFCFHFFQQPTDYFTGWNWGRWQYPGVSFLNLFLTYLPASETSLPASPKVFQINDLAGDSSCGRICFSYHLSGIVFSWIMFVPRGKYYSNTTSPPPNTFSLNNFDEAGRLVWKGVDYHKNNNYWRLLKIFCSSLRLIVSFSPLS